MMTASGTSTTRAPGSTTPRTEEAAIAWPTGLLVVVPVGVAGMAAVVWALVGWLGPWTIDAGVAGVAGSAIVAVVTVASLIAMGPWRTRPISTWMQLWLAGTVVRLLTVPVVTYVLYSATSLRAAPLALGVGLTYVLTLIAEAAVLARHVGRTA